VGSTRAAGDTTGAAFRAAAGSPGEDTAAVDIQAAVVGSQAAAEGSLKEGSQAAEEGSQAFVVGDTSATEGIVPVAAAGILPSAVVGSQAAAEGSPEEGSQASVVGDNLAAGVGTLPFKRNPRAADRRRTAQHRKSVWWPSLSCAGQPVHCNR